MYEYEALPPPINNLLSPLNHSQTENTPEPKMFQPCHLNNILTHSILFITSIFELDSLSLSQIALNIVAGSDDVPLKLIAKDGNGGEGAGVRAGAENGN